MTDINQEIKDLEATLVSLKAKAKALVDGRTFKTSGGRILLYEDNSAYSSPFRTKHAVGYYHYMRREWDSYADLQEINAAPQPWYLNIPEEGIECYVSDDDPNPSLIKVIIREYNSRLSFPFRSSLLRWKYATPVNGGK